MALGGGVGGGAIKAGAAFVELVASDKGLGAALNRAMAKLRAFDSAVTRLGAGLAAAGGGVLAPITGLFAAAVNQGNTLDQLARQLGTTVEQVSALGYAFESSGLKQEEFADIAKSLDQKLAQAMDGSEEAATAFGRLGLNAATLVKMDLAERLGTVGQALSQVALASDRTEFSMKLLGGQGQKALRLLGDGAAGVREAMQDAADTGAVVTTEQATQAREIEGAWNKLSTAMKAAFMEVGKAILPQAESVKDLSAYILGAARGVREFLSNNKSLILTVAGVAAGVTAAGTALAAFGGVAVLVSAGIGGLLTLVAGLKAAFVALFTPVGLVTGALVGLGYLFATQTETGQQMLGWLSSSFRSLAETVVEVWGGIASALRRGDLAAAGEIAMAALNVAFQNGLLALRSLWVGFKLFLMNAWDNIGPNWERAFLEIATSLKRIFSGVITALLEQASRLAEALGDSKLASALGEFKRGAELDAKLATLTAERDRKRIVEGRSEVSARRDAAAAAELAGNRLALEEARKRLAELLKAEADKAPDARTVPPAVAQVGAQMQSLAQSVRGAFSAPDYRQLFGAGDSVAQRQIRVQEQTRDAVKEVGKKLDALTPPAFEG